MKTNLDDTILMNMVFRCLCRILKNRKIYHRFRCFIGYGNNTIFNRDLTTTIYSVLKCMQPYVINAQRMGNSFYHSSNKEDIFITLSQIVGKENKITKDNCDDVGKVQMRITQFINTLLHSCVESIVNNFSEVEHIGQDTFEMVCKQIYGKDFVDETENSIPEDVKKMIDAQREYLQRNDMIDPMGLSRDFNFIQFLKDRGIIDTNGIRRRPHIQMVPPSPETLNEEENDGSDWDNFEHDNFEWDNFEWDVF